MPRNTIRDILPPEHRKRRAKRPAERIREEMQAEESEPVKEVSEPLTGHSNRLPPHDHTNVFDDFEEDDGFWKPGLIIKVVSAIVVVIVVAGLVSALAFSGAEVTVTPKTTDVTLQATFTAKEKAGPGELSFEFLKIEKTDSQTVTATGEEYAEEKATGVITIYNAYSNDDQRLIRNTRFETPDGLIYRINESVVVPGQSTVAGVTTPGSLDVTVYADEPGETYNLATAQFTIPGFKGAPQFEHFYAETKTALAGGFAGDRLTVDPANLEAARNELRATLQEALLAEVGTRVTDNFYLFEDGIFVDFASQPIVDEGANARIEENATLYGIMFKAEEFSKFVGENGTASYDGESVLLKDPMSSITVTVDTEAENKPWETGEALVTISGTDMLVWQFDDERLREDLTGRNKDATHTILSGYPGIDQAEAVIRPFWKGSFPNDIEKIKINNTLPIGGNGAETADDSSDEA